MKWDVNFRLNVTLLKHWSTLMREGRVPLMLLSSDSALWRQQLLVYIILVSYESETKRLNKEEKDENKHVSHELLGLTPWSRGGVHGRIHGNNRSISSHALMCFIMRRGRRRPRPQHARLSPASLWLVHRAMRGGAYAVVWCVTWTRPGGKYLEIWDGWRRVMWPQAWSALIGRGTFEHHRVCY